MRLFVAVNLPGPEQERVMTAAAALRSADLPVRWVEPDALHITLKFLGEVPEPEYDPVAQAVMDVASRHPGFRLELRGAGAFPNARRPAVWWIGVAPSEPLHRLRQDVEDTLSPLGFPTEARPFSPHLTLGRTRRDGAGRRGGARAPDAEALLQRVALHSTFTVETLDLMRSHLSPRGARYERVLAAALA